MNLKKIKFVLSRGEPNPLNVTDLRRIDHCPPHFTKVTFEPFAKEKVFSDWLWENLEGRFYIGDQIVDRKDTGTLCMAATLVGFELPTEASYFSLLIPTLNHPDFT